MRRKDKTAIVVAAGQTPADPIENDRATAVLFARKGARVLLVDRNLESALETTSMIEHAGGTATTMPYVRTARWETCGRSRTWPRHGQAPLRSA